ncbi:DNA-binding transcriptional regulator, GntR family [Yoonia tamlensis]|uniref:DNA-binding transcriptional regulator, GntR family n=1 Tax=Yoonia tamlensis TaxID=390270 RepID=A0A1I6HE16_9RHOB|nr:GntR family transcriptional regulator [Yoonia tamlensis]SFR52537.1 DNA-binding transcriptional regulator, GntR family [Yoonia tamlensis]
MSGQGILALSAHKEDAQTSANAIYESIRHDILSGKLGANARLKVSELARIHDTSTNPVREALQQLRGEGLVLFAPNQGARVRPIDMEFVRDVVEVGVLLEPYLLRWFVETASDADVAKLRGLQAEMEMLNFQDKPRHTVLDSTFHETMYARHYNRVAYGVWKQHREIISSISTRVPIALGRQKAILLEHRDLIEAISAQETDRAVAVLTQHIGDAGRHLVDQLRIEETLATQAVKG